MSSADLARDETDATLERLRFDLWTLMVAMRYAERRCLRLQHYQRRRRAAGLVDAIASGQAYEAWRRYRATAERVALDIARVLDRQAGDGLSRIEAGIRNELAASRDGAPV